MAKEEGIGDRNGAWKRLLRSVLVLGFVFFAVVASGCRKGGGHAIVLDGCVGSANAATVTGRMAVMPPRDDGRSTVILTDQHGAETLVLFRGVEKSLRAKDGQVVEALGRIRKGKGLIPSFTDAAGKKVKGSIRLLYERAGADPQGLVDLELGELQFLEACK